MLVLEKSLYMQARFFASLRFAQNDRGDVNMNSLLYVRHNFGIEMAGG
jgi:hypothetical protein